MARKRIELAKGALWGIPIGLVIVVTMVALIMVSIFTLAFPRAGSFLVPLGSLGLSFFGLIVGVWLVKRGVKAGNAIHELEKVPTTIEATVLDRCTEEHENESLRGSPIPAQPPDEREIAPVERASFWRRLLAFVVDGIILSLIEGTVSSFIDLEDVPPWLGVAVGVLIPAIYFVRAYSTSGQTGGKSLLRIKVVSVDGSPLDWRKGILRSVGYVISSIPLCLGFLWSIWDADRQTWHDKIAGTCVVRASVAPEQLQGTIDPSEAQRRQRRWLLGLGIATLLIALAGGGIWLSFSQSIQSEIAASGELVQWEATCQITIHSPCLTLI